MVGDGPGANCAGCSAGAELQRAGTDQRDAAVGVVRRENQRAAAVLHQSTAAGNQVGERDRIGAVEREVGIVGDVGRAERADGAPGAHLKRAGVDQCDAAVGVVAGEDDGAAAVLFHAAGAGDETRIGRQIAAVEGQVGVVGDVAGPERADGAAVADLQRAGIDQSNTAVGVVGCENQRTAAALHQPTTTGDQVGKRD